jgi:hypothetical protein
MALTAITAATPTVGSKGPKQFQGVFDVIPFKVTLTDASLPATTASQADIAVAGAELGDIVLIGAPVDLDAGILAAQVLSAGNVTVTFFNANDGAANTSLAAGIECNGLVLKPKANVYDEL